MVNRLRLVGAVWGPMPLGPAVSTEPFVLPVGTATFVSAEMEGSTGPPEADRAEGVEATGRLDAIFTTAVRRHAGVRPIGRHTGNSFVAAFARASEAAACALDVQREAEAEALPRVRMGLHSGEAQLRDETRYFGEAISRTARLRDLGHGGQVLLSAACADLVCDHLPAGASLEDLGSHRMRDLTRAVQVYQLVHPDLAGDFPLLRSLERHAHNLPVQLTSFVGRERAIVEVAEMLASGGLVTLTGSGGSGKTRLALQVAAEALGTRADAAWFVDLSGLADPDLVPAAAMAATGMREIRDQSHVETLTIGLRDRDALIVFDNCEHVLSAASALAEALARDCGQLAVLATSREPLGVAGEVVWRVPCLSLPPESAAVDIESLDACEAVRLFRDRARTARPNFAITNDNAPAVAAICQRLDGIPLAIELAAARARLMSVEQIAEALADRFHLLAGGARSALPRQQTLRASVDWSHELLAEPERAVLRRLSVFAGGLTLDAAEFVGAAADVDRYEVLDLLSALVDKSLVQVNETADRYRLLETIRAYSAEELAAAGEDRAARTGHLSFFAELAERADQGMSTSATAAWLAVLDVEHDNLRAALDWSLESAAFDTGARLVCAVGQFLFIRGFRTEGGRRCEEFLAHDVAAPRRVELCGWAAILARNFDPAAAVRHAEALIALGRDLGDDRALARGQAQVGFAQGFTDPSTALTTLEDALATARAVGDVNTVVDCLSWSAAANTALGRFRDALRCAEEAQATAQRSDYLWGSGYAMVKVGEAALQLGELDRAADAATGLMELAVNLEDQWFTLCAHWLRGVVAIHRCEPSAAEGLAVTRELAERTHDQLNLGHICCDEGAALLALGRDEDGRRVLEAAIPMTDPFQPIPAARARFQLAEAAVRRADLTEARRWLDEALAMPLADQLLHAARTRARLARARGDPHLAWKLADQGLQSAHTSGAQLLAVDFLELLALLASDTQRYVAAARLLAVSAKQRERLGYVSSAADRAVVEGVNGRIDAALGHAGRSAAAAEGSALTLQEAVEYARRGRGRRARAISGWGSLTPTERRVAELVVEGLTNAEIAARMFVSVATVKTHLTHIFAKLAVTNRRQLADAARAAII